MDNKNRNEGISVAGFVLSFLMPMIGLVLSVIGLTKSRKNGTNTGLAIAGLAISAIRLIIGLFVIIPLLFVFIISAAEESHYESSKSKPNVCEHAYSCKKTAGNMYKCNYVEDGIKKDIYCFENALDDYQIQKEEKENNTAYDLEKIEELVSKHYMKYYDGLMDHARAKEIDNKMVEVTIFNDIEETKSGLVYTISSETLIGKDSHNYYVDLNEFKQEIPNL